MEETRDPLEFLGEERSHSPPASLPRLLSPVVFSHAPQVDLVRAR